MSDECDQMVIFNIWPFSIIKIYPIVYYFGQSRFKIFQLLKDPQTLPNVFQILPKWQNFAQSGNTGPPVRTEKKF